jgi:GntR family transcriptional regulator, transcriptional repressor for pyruvate dehydrogenase complex
MTDRRERGGSGAARAAAAKHPGAAGSGVLSRLRAMIERDGYEAGQKLPPEREMAAELKIGRPGLREAIKALSILGVLESRQGDGTYVKSVSALSLRWPQQVAEVPANFDMLELLEVRKIIEPQAASLAAARASAHQLAEIQKEMLTPEVEDRALIGDHDYLFHDAIVRAAGNPILSGVMRSMAAILIKSRHITSATAPDFSRMFREHRAIYESIRRGQSDLAARAMLDHLQTVGMDLISM